METTVETSTIEEPINGSKPPLRTNDMTDEQLQAMLSLPERFKNNPEFVERLFEEAKEVRRRINEEFLRELDAEENK